MPHIPDFLCSFVGSLNCMRLSFKKGAQAVLSRAACRKFGASRSFFREMWTTVLDANLKPMVPHVCGCDCDAKKPRDCRGLCFS